MLKVLLKKQMRALYYALFKGKKKGSMSGKGTIITLTLLFLFTFVSLLFAFVGISFMFSDILFPVEMFWLYFGLIAAISIFVSAFVDAFSTATTLYAAKDDEFLRTLPIKESTILMSRIVSVFILGFIFNFSVMAPAYGVYWAFMGFSVKTLITALIMLPVSTVLITVVTCIVAYVIHQISVKVKSKLVTAAISIALIMGVYYFIYFRLNTALTKLMENIFTIGEVMKNRVWFIYLIGQAFSGDFISILGRNGSGKSTLAKHINAHLEDKEMVDAIAEMVEGTEGVLGIHDLVVHNYGPGKVFASIHVEVDSEGNLMDSHDMIDRIEMRIRKALNIEVTCHMDPVEINNPVRLAAISTLEETIKKLAGVESFHDVRVVPGPTHTNIIFDLVLTPGIDVDRDAVKDFLQDEISKLDSKYFIVINFDMAYAWDTKQR